MISRPEQTIIAPNQEHRIQFCAERYGDDPERLKTALNGALGGVLIGQAGQLLGSLQEGPFASVTRLPDFTPTLADEIFKTRTVELIENRLSTTHPGIRQVMKVLHDTIGAEFQMLGSWSRVGLVNDEDISTQDYCDFDFGISLTGAVPDLTSDELLAHVEQICFKLFPDASTHYSFINENGNYFIDQDSDKQLKLVFTVNGENVHFSFEPTFKHDPQTGNLALFPYEKHRDVTEDTPTAGYANVKAPDALSNPVDLRVNEDGSITVSPENVWNVPFLNTIVYGENGMASQVVGFTQEQFDWYRQDPQNRIYFLFNSILGKRYVFDQKLEGLLFQPLVDEKSKMIYNFTTGRVYRRENNLLSPDEIDLRLFIFSAKLLEDLAFCEEVPDDKKNMDKFNKAVELVRSSFKNAFPKDFSGFEEFAIIQQLLGNNDKGKMPDLNELGSLVDAAFAKIDLKRYRARDFGIAKPGEASFHNFLDFEQVLIPAWNFKVKHLTWLIGGYEASMVGFFLLKAKEFGFLDNPSLMLGVFAAFLGLNAGMAALFLKQFYTLGDPELTSFTMNQIDGYYSMKAGRQKNEPIAITQQVRPEI